MLKWILILSALVFTTEGHASWPFSRSMDEGTLVLASEAGVCVQCQNSGRSAMDALKQFTSQMNQITDGALDIELISDKMNYAEKCENFVGNGEVNIWGKVIKKELEKEKYSTLLSEGPKDIANYCPSFSGMSLSDRKALNILIITAMAHYESSCNFREKAPGPNGTAAGLLQLHRGKEGRYSSGCRNGDASSAERSLVCGLSMLNDQVVARGERLFSSASYWEVLRPRGRSQKAKKIMAAIKKFPACSGKKESLASHDAEKRNRVAMVAN